MHRWRSRGSLTRNECQQHGRSFETSPEREQSFPAIWRLEVANALRTAVRKLRCDNTYAKRSIARFARLPISADSHTDHHAWGETLQLSRRYDLTPYDAAYLELAIRLGHPLASYDGALVQAARKCALKVLTAP